MFSIKDIRKKSFKNLKTNYLTKVFVCLFTLLVLGSFGLTKSALNNGKDLLTSYIPEIVNYNKSKNITIETKAKKGVFKKVYDVSKDVVASSEIYITSAENLVKKVINNDSVFNIVNISFSILITVLFKVFVLDVIAVGEYRFFLESKKYKKTKFTRIFSLFKRKKYLATVKTIFVKNLYSYLWDLTIIGGLIKFYSYRMVKFIVAENPNIKPNEAINLSRKIMNGNKFKMFLLDMSFIGYEILNVITFGLVGIFFLDPYIREAEVSIYYNLREKYLDKYPNYFNDKELDITNIEDYYPGTKKEEIKLDYYRRYSLTSFILFFFSFSFVGWCWEVLLEIVKHSRFVNRGTLMGPWLPIYGWGCVLVLLLMIPKKAKKITDKPLVTFFLIMVICALIEYFTSWYLETFKCARWWSYYGYFLNINGRICLECSIFFGIGGTFCIYFMAPKLDKVFNKISPDKKSLICIILVSLFIIDSMYSSKHPNMGAGISSNINPGVESKYCKEKN